MTLEITTDYLDQTYEVIAEISIVSDNLGVSGSGFVEIDVTRLEVYDYHTGALISLDANRALKDVIEEQINQEVFRMGLV